MGGSNATLSPACMQKFHDVFPSRLASRRRRGTRAHDDRAARALQEAEPCLPKAGHHVPVSLGASTCALADVLGSDGVSEGQYAIVLSQGLLVRVYRPPQPNIWSELMDIRNIGRVRRGRRGPHRHNLRDCSKAS
jgi:hypothetical protein